MKIAATFHQPACTLAAVKCRLASSDMEHLVVAKPHKLEVYFIQPGGLSLACTLEIWGNIVALKALPIPNSPRSNLVVMLDHPDPELVFLTYSESADGVGTLTTKHSMSLFERIPRQAEFFNDVVLHPTGKIMVVSCYMGKLKVVVLKYGMYDRDFDVTLFELNVLSITFLPVSEEGIYCLAILHIDRNDRTMLLARDLDIDNLELDPTPSVLFKGTPISSKIIPSPSQLQPKLVPIPAIIPGQDANTCTEPIFRGGVIILGGKKVVLYEMADENSQNKQRGKARRLHERKSGKNENEVEAARLKEKERENRKRKARAQVDWGWSEVAAWCTIDVTSTKFLIGDIFGRLVMLSLDMLTKLGLILLPLGETSPAASLTYLTSQFVFVASHVGHAQLINISPTPVSTLHRPTLPIPTYIKTVPPSTLTGATALTISQGKGKKRAFGDEGRTQDANSDMDIDMDEGEDIDTQEQEKIEAAERGCIIEGKGSYVRVVDEWKNIAPIVDAIIVDTDGSGQKQIVTCSGDRNTGSINVIRSGAQFQELAKLKGIEEVTGVWSIREAFDDQSDTHIVLSTPTSTQLFKLDTTEAKVHHVEPAIQGMNINLRTLAMGNIARRTQNPQTKVSSYGNSPYLIQVTKRGVTLLSYNAGVGEWAMVSTWEAANQGLNEGSNTPVEVIAADLNPSQVALAISGGYLIVLTLSGEQLKVVSKSCVGDRIKDTDISVVTCAPIGSSKFFANHVAIAYWCSNCIEVFRMEANGTLKSVSKSQPLPAVVRSLAMINYGSDDSMKGENYHPYVVAGLGDGNVVTFAWKNAVNSKGRVLQDFKVWNLGMAPVTRLCVCEVEGNQTVFAIGSQSMVLCWETGLLKSWTVMVKNVVAVAKISTEKFPGCLLLVGHAGFSIGQVKDLSKMHIRSIPVGYDIPRKITYDPVAKVFGVACTRRDPVGIDEIDKVQSSFQLRDGDTLEGMSYFNCEPGEEVLSVARVTQTSDGLPISAYCVGTFLFEDSQPEPSDGNIFVLAANVSEQSLANTRRSLQLSVLTNIHVKGGVYTLAPVKDMIAAGVNSAVLLYKLTKSNDPVPEFTLQQVYEWNYSYMVTSLAAYGDYLIIGDHIHSLSVLKVEGAALRTVARDYAPLWPVSIGVCSEKSFIGANDVNNIFTFFLSQAGQRPFLEMDGNYHIGEQITKFIHDALAIPDKNANSSLEPQYMFFTSLGRIGVVVDVKEERLGLQLTALQRNLGYVTEGAGELTHAQYRAPKSIRGRREADGASIGFLDGDFLEKFIGYLSSPELVEKVVAGHNDAERLTMSTDDFRKMLEALQAMH